MGGSKGHQRGRKTHRADQLINRGARELPEEAYQSRSRADEETTDRQEQIRDEHPTGRMRATGRQPDRRNR